ncbi:TetR/AcrR family transcriptional regulator [Bacillus sp. 1NLA3E]|uniref:TetR/AcrR family transcriptional regulator n=1 Tax=Bacillus sp. 1NLA3E TaxID=666686 RepID=UPI000247E874|nr:TetR/AcrR family transcriptional regulator [Bacillus sp. 1NLA3E]AGK55869.1 transcriptional regulator [Bacillus sp. 1NLA3E]
MNKGERTKNYIIEQSSSLFNRNGYKSTSISDIMAATGLKKGGIYNHFENKDSLANASFSYAFNKMKENYKSAVASKSTAHEKFYAFISVFKTLQQDSIIIGGCPLMNASIEADDSKIEFEDSIKEGFTALIRLINGIIQHGQNHGEIKMDINADQMSVFVISSLEGALALSRLYKDESYLEMVIAQLSGILFS